MEKKALLAVVLSLLVLYIFQSYFVPPKAPNEPSSPQKIVEPSAPEPAPEETAPTPPLSEVSRPEASLSSPEKEIRVETDFFTAIFSTHGAVLKSWVLKKYFDHLGPNRKPVEMVVGEKAGPYPLGVSLIQNQTSEPLEVNFSTDREKYDFTGGRVDGQVVFSGVTSSGFKVAKIFTFYPQRYFVDLKVEIRAPTPNPLRDGLSISWIRKPESGKDTSKFVFTGPVAYAGGKLNEIKAKDLSKGPKTFADQVGWIGYEDKYFLAALVPPKNKNMIAEVVQTEQGEILIETSGPGSPGSNGGAVFSCGFYCGPKDLELLRSLNLGLERVINFGMFDIIAKPLLYTLKYLDKVTRNYGLAIILLTIILKIIFFPLTHKGYKSMKEMKDLQPKMMALRERFKDDKERLNREIMDLYRTHKVNPLGGCLPLVLQFPIFIAFYSVLLGSIELRHAPFMLWINDLSAQDPYYVTPILMGISMFIQQKMTPTVGDPTQAKVMLAMPIVFTFMFLKFPSGLVIYWFVNNILQIFQQLYIDKRVA